MHRELRALARAAERQGWSVERTRNNHLKWKPPQGQYYVSSSTPSDHRALRNIRAHLIQRGLRLS